MTIVARALIAASMLAPASAIGRPAAPMPVVPIASTMLHWDNHWYIWLPQDDRFEAVEVMSVNRGPGERPLVWVFFTERAGGKRQVHYVNEAAMARDTGWHHVPISYSVSGKDGEPRGVDVRMTDIDHRPVSIHLSVDGARPLKPAGLTDQSGHAANSILLMFYRGQDTLGTDWFVRIAGRVVSAPGLAYVAPAPPAYSRDISTALFPFGSFSARFGGDGTHGPSGLRFHRVAGGAYVARASEGTRKMLEADEAGRLRDYADFDGNHALRVDFARPIPSPCWPSVPTTIPFSITIDGRPGLLTGSVDYQPGPTSALNWRFDTPAWATHRHLTTAIRSDCDQRAQNLVVSPGGAIG